MGLRGLIDARFEEGYYDVVISRAIVASALNGLRTVRFATEGLIDFDLR